MTSMSRGKARIGVFVPFTNTNLEADMALMRPEGISFHYARLGGYDLDEIPDAGQMAGLGKSEIDEPLRLLAGTRPDVILYGCTSATLAIGPQFDRDLAESIRDASGAETVTAAGALVNALNTLEVKRIAFASPYVKPLNNDAIAFLSSCGFETVSRADFPEALDNYGQGLITPERVLELGLEADSDTAEAIVLSCTDMRAVEVIEALEGATGKPVISSNQAMLFQALQKLGIASFQAGFGSLFQNLAERTEARETMAVS